LVAAISANRRQSSAPVRIVRLSRDQRWPEEAMQNVHVLCCILSQGSVDIIEKNSGRKDKTKR
jgi:hypothetical protein